MNAAIFNLEQQLQKLCEQLAATAVERDRAGGHAAAERQLLRQSGLLTLAVPKIDGGFGENWPTILQSVRRIAAVDSSLAHLFAFQHLQVASIIFFGSEAQQRELLSRTVQENWFWGNALNPADQRSQAVEQAGGLLINGQKGFCSGALGADYLLVSAHLPDGKFVVAAIPAKRAGITIADDWDAFGQRQTDSGTVHFDNVRVAVQERLNGAGNGSAFANLRSVLAQAMLVNIYLGIAQGAFDAARANAQTRKAWVNAKVDAAREDPYVLQRFAELWLKLRSASVFADKAARQLDYAWAQGPSLSDCERGDAAIAVAEAKVLAHRASLDISSELFDINGASAAKGSAGLDRFWRNARTHTLHDPLDYKLRDLGNWALNGHYPTPTPYS